MQRGLFVPGELNNARLGLDSPGPTHNTFGTSQVTGRRSPAFSFGATFVHDKKSGVSSSGCGGVGGICSVLKHRFDCLRHRLLGLAQLAMTLASACSSKWMVNIAPHQRLSFPRHRVRKGARSSLRYVRVVARHACRLLVSSHTHASMLHWDCRALSTQVWRHLVPCILVWTPWVHSRMGGTPHRLAQHSAKKCAS